MKRIVIFSLLWLAGIGLSGCSEATTQTTTTGSNQATASSVVKQQTAEISFVNKKMRSLNKYQPKRCHSKKEPL